MGHCIDCPWDYGFWLHLFSWVIVLTVLGITASDYTFSLGSLYWLSLGLRLLIAPFLLVIVLTVLGITASDYTFSLGSLNWLSLGLQSEAVIPRTVNTMTKRKGVIRSRNLKDSQYNDPREKVYSEAVISRTVNTMSDYTFSLNHCIDCPWDYGFWLHLFSWVIVLTVLGITASDYTFSLGSLYWLTLGTQEKRCNQKP
jgi:hypothetical protein